MQLSERGVLVATRKEQKMKLSKLKKLLETKAISQEEYDEMAKTAEDDTQDDEGDNGDGDDDGGDDGSDDDLDARISKAVQSAVDRATNKLGNENKKLKDQLQAERKKNLSADELKQVELQEKEDAIALKEKEIKEKENRMYAIKALKKAELDDGSEDALELIDFVLGEDETAIDLRVKALQKFAQRIAKNTTDGIYKSNGRTPGKSNTGSSKENPWSKENWNLTKQMQIEINDPELAKTLKASAGN